MEPQRNVTCPSVAYTPVQNHWCQLSRRVHSSGAQCLVRMGSIEFLEDDIPQRFLIRLGWNLIIFKGFGEALAKWSAGHFPMSPISLFDCTMLQWLANKKMSVEHETTIQPYYVSEDVGYSSMGTKLQHAALNYVQYTWIVAESSYITFHALMSCNSVVQRYERHCLDGWRTSSDGLHEATATTSYPSTSEQRALCMRTFKKNSADIAPLVPELKLSKKRTQLRSRGTVVPPEVITTTGAADASASTCA